MLTDYGCGSACISFVDEMLQFPGVRQIGLETFVDMRSASRYGSHDFGRNASRIKEFYTELQARLEAAVPAAIAGRGKAKAKGRKVPPRAQKGARDRGQAPRK